MANDALRCMLSCDEGMSQLRLPGLERLGASGERAPWLPDAGDDACSLRHGIPPGETEPAKQLDGYRNAVLDLCVSSGRCGGVLLRHIHHVSLSKFLQPFQTEFRADSRMLCTADRDVGKIDHVRIDPYDSGVDFECDRQCSFRIT